MPRRKANEPDLDEVLATIDPHPIRRVFTTGVVGVLGVLLIYVAAASPPADPGWLVFLLVLGGGSVYLAWRVWGATAVRLELTRRELLNSFQKHGIHEVNPQDEKFDPNFHQAMFEVPGSGKPNGTVVQVVQTGYKIGERLLRPALVGVAKNAGEAKS
jgi:hypothetical protein